LFSLQIDLSENHFDLAIPGGGQGIFSGCTAQFGKFPGAHFGEVSINVGQCNQLPQVLRQGCRWRFG
jgi:hypothetical protein